MIPMEARRRFFAEEIEAIAGLRNPAIVDAFAAVPRERFLPPGPWTVRSESDLGAAPRRTADADPRRVYHNYAVAIDAGRQLFNGQPSLLAMAIDQLGLGSGSRVLHIGTGPGYYTAIIGHVVGPTGRVLGIEVDEQLAANARRNLADLPWIEIRHGDASGRLAERFDAVLVNAGVTHPRAEWIDALAETGRMVLPLTASMPAMGNTIGKGLLLLLSRGADPTTLDARVISFVAIYSAVGLRDAAIEGQLGKALAAMPLPRLKRLRRDAHEPSETCWLHVAGACLSL
jgi:protein-L-isoaspartate(D-aspartate) O-methyltransferase